MILKRYNLGLNIASHKLFILFLTSAASLTLSFYVNFVLGKDLFYTHTFYIPIILAGIWYYKKAVYLALILGIALIFIIYLSPLDVGRDNFARSGAFIIIAYVIGYVSQKNAEEKFLGGKTEQVVRHHTTLLKLTKKNYSDLDSALKEITKIDSQILGVEMVGVGFLNKDRSEITCEQFYKLSTNLYEEGYPLRVSGYPQYFQALEDGRIIAANDVYTDPRTRELTKDYLKPHNITSTMDVSIRLHGKLVGILYHEHVGPKREWTPEEQDFAASVADIISLIMETLQSKQAEIAIKSSFTQLAETVSRAMETQDPYTAEHQRRVAELSRWVGKKIGLSEEELLGLYIAGLLHDIGKISIPMVILAYPGKLREAEWAIIRSHTRSGYEILKETQFPWPVAELAMYHHERLDGSGYPDGLKGSELSQGMRILAVCDVVEAMSSVRPYRPARPRAEVLEELFRGKGTKYDPQVVDILLGFLNETQADYFEFRGNNA